MESTWRGRLPVYPPCISSLPSKSSTACWNLAGNPFISCSKKPLRYVAAIPCYIKTNSYGELVFDHSWAQAYERSGLHYYPKLVSAIPYTPATGPRFLIQREIKDSAKIHSLKIDLIRTSQTILYESCIEWLACSVRTRIRGEGICR